MISIYKDLVECCNCGYKGKVAKGAEYCPECRKKGCLKWQNDNKQEVEA